MQQRLGHRLISVTLDRYGHPMDGLDERAADKLDDLFVTPGEGQVRGRPAKAAGSKRIGPSLTRGSIGSPDRVRTGVSGLKGRFRVIRTNPADLGRGRRRPLSCLFECCDTARPSSSFRVVFVPLVAQVWPKPQARTSPGVDQFHCTTN